jgi:hypothetical protein
MPDEISKVCIFKKMGKDTASVLATIPGAFLYLFILFIKRSIEITREFIHITPSVIHFLLRGFFHPFRNPDEATGAFILLAVPFCLITIFSHQSIITIIAATSVLVCMLISGCIHPFLDWYNASYNYCLEHKGDEK